MKKCRHDVVNAFNGRIQNDINCSANKITPLAFVVIFGLLGSLAMTGCNQKPADTVTESPQLKEHSHEEHSHKEHSHEKHNHEHSHKHDEHEHDHSHEHDEKGVKHIGKHVHGEAELNAVVDGNALVLELNSPAMNIFGFEHQPSTDEQKATVETQEKRLKDASKLFNIDGGDCAVADVDVDMPFENDHEQAEHTEENTHKDEEHEHKHEEHTHKSHEEHAHEHQHKDGSVHSDVKATYNFTCKDSKNIKGITINVFSTFTGFTKLNTKWIKADKQGATTLTKHSYTIIFE